VLATKTRFLIPLQRNTKVAVDEEFALALQTCAGRGMTGSEPFFLCAKITGDEERAKASKRKPARRKFPKRSLENNASPQTGGRSRYAPNSARFVFSQPRWILTGFKTKTVFNLSHRRVRSYR